MTNASAKTTKWPASAGDAAPVIQKEPDSEERNSDPAAWATQYV